MAKAHLTPSREDSHVGISCAPLPTLSTVARERARVLRALADDLERHNFDDPDGNARIADAVERLYDR